MYKKIVALLLVSSMLAFAGCDKTPTSGNDTPGVEDNQDKTSADIELTSSEAIKEAREMLWEEYLEEIKNDETRKAEVANRKMEFGDVTMKYGMQIKGDPDENGYPLYIALHGGGGSDTPDVNDSQWAQMSTYYGKNVKQGIYINPRGVRDTWDTHANPESFPLYDRLIENMIAFCNADPNRVYIMGFSAGGDGVYIITPKMTDRFAAANMSAGHPNGINLTNLYNMPIQLQCGMQDAAYGRNTVTAEYDAILEGYAAAYGGGYIHQTYIHKNYAHNFYDNHAAEQEVLADLKAWLAIGDTTSVMAKTKAVDWVNQYTRTPLPERVIWEFTNRANQREVESNYWLSASFDVTEGMIIASYDKASNTITIEENTANGAVTVLINEDMLDVFSPITVKTPTDSYEVNVTPDYELLKSTTYERGDENYQFVASIVIE